MFFQNLFFQLFMIQSAKLAEISPAMTANASLPNCAVISSATAQEPIMRMRPDVIRTWLNSKPVSSTSSKAPKRTCIII